MKNRYDIIVIGSGPGGEGAAMKAIKSGKKVAICDLFANIRGNCTHRGTIPSKALRHATQILESRDEFSNVNYQDLLSGAESVIKSQKELRRGFYKRNWVDIIDGHTKFIDANTIQVDHTNGGNNLMYFVNTTFNYPTLAEAYRVAALNGLNRVE